MCGRKMETPACGQARPGQDNRYATEAENPQSASDGRPPQRLARLWAAVLAIAAGVAP
jgi:hypothetical protein